MSKNIKIDNSGLEKKRKELLKLMKLKQVDAAIIYAKNLLRKAWIESEFVNRTSNLLDSYVWVVYVDGIYRDHGFVNESPLATQKIKQTRTGNMQFGREQANEFVSSHTPRSIKGLEIVFATTMYYSAFLENGTARNRRYVVLTGILDDVSADFKSNNIRVQNDYYEY